MCNHSPGIYVLGYEPLEGAGSIVFPELPSNAGACFEKSTSCVTPLFESVLDPARAALLSFSLFLVVSVWSIPDSFSQFLLAMVLRLLYLMVSNNSLCPRCN